MYNAEGRSRRNTYISRVGNPHQLEVDDHGYAQGQLQLFVRHYRKSQQAVGQHAKEQVGDFNKDVRPSHDAPKVISIHHFE